MYPASCDSDWAICVAFKIEHLYDQGTHSWRPSPFSLSWSPRARRGSLTCWARRLRPEASSWVPDESTPPRVFIRGYQTWDNQWITPNPMIYIELYWFVTIYHHVPPLKLHFLGYPRSPDIPHFDPQTPHLPRCRSVPWPPRRSHSPSVRRPWRNTRRRLRCRPLVLGSRRRNCSSLHLWFTTLKSSCHYLSSILISSHLISDHFS